MAAMLLPNCCLLITFLTCKVMALLPCPRLARRIYPRPTDCIYYLFYYYRFNWATKGGIRSQLLSTSLKLRTPVAPLLLKYVQQKGKHLF